MELRMTEIARATGADYYGPEDAVITAVSTDTRTLPQGCLFIALRGETFDGNAYVAQALEQGAAYALAEQMPVHALSERILVVPDGRQALLQVAGLYRRQLDIRVVGITGSVGKTTTKEMVACVMEAAWPTLKTPQNLNNEVGLSKTILTLEKQHRVAVLEMGVDAPGQMSPLSLCARPDVAIITNIGVSHLSQFGTRDAIAEEKLKITDGMQGFGTLILNADDAMLAQVVGLAGGPTAVFEVEGETFRQVESPSTEGYTCNILRYGIETRDRTDARAEEIREYSTHTDFRIRYNGSHFHASIPCMGRHNVSNALAAFLAGMVLGMQPEAAAAALNHYKPTGMRQNVVEHGGFTVVEDCYNASPDSMRAALTTLGRLTCTGRRIAVLSDMLELGEIAVEAHRSTGRLAAECNVDLLLCTGEFAREYVAGAREAGMEHALHFDSQQALFSFIRETVAQGDILWFKASHGMKLEDVIETVYREC